MFRIIGAFQTRPKKKKKWNSDLESTPQKHLGLLYEEKVVFLLYVHEVR